jgi:hypothetical protein
VNIGPPRGNVILCLNVEAAKIMERDRMKEESHIPTLNHLTSLQQNTVMGNIVMER